MSTRSRRFRTLALSASTLLVALNGCDKDNPVSPIDDTPVRNTTDPAELARAHADALSRRDLDHYAALLEPPAGPSVGFEYIPRAEDRDDFPWVAEDGWGYDAEVGMVAHMMDPDFMSQATGSGVDNIDMHLAIASQRAMEDGGIEVTCSVDFAVFWGESGGVRGDMLLVMAMYPDTDGFLRIRSIEERPTFGARDVVVLQFSTWGRAKALYR